MKHVLLFAIGLFGFCYLMNAQKTLPDTIRANYIRLLLPSLNEDILTQALLNIPPEKELSDQAVVELHQRYPLTREKICQYVETLSSDGSWPDINYKDSKRSGWEPKKHAERVLEMAKYKYNLRDEDTFTKEVTQAIHLAINFWIQERPVCQNWWYNQIGLPKTWGPAFILLKDELSAEEKQGAIEIMEEARIGMTGQNKVWLAGNVLMKAILQDNNSLIKEAREAILEEITTDAKEGIKSDWSFHQHGPMQQFGNYGLTYLTEMSFYSNLFAGTSLAMNSQQQSIINNLLLHGYRWVIWNGHMDINALGRQLFHNAPLHKALSTGFAARSLSANSTTREKEHLKSYIEDNFLPDISGSAFTGHKHFWDSDLTIHRTPTWMASVKMASTRVLGTELVNEDNLKGYYMADGATYIYRRGDEYLNVFPFWDWRKIPGITTYNSTEPVPTNYGPHARNQSSFVGGMTDGKTGITAMEFNRDGVKARKAWIFTDTFVLCLGADIQTDSCLQLITSVDQRLKKEELLQLKDKDNNTRYYHDGIGYIFPQPSSVTAISEKRSGQWHDFMGMYTPAVVTGEIISLQINHRNDTPDTYQYILLPDVTPEQVMNFNTTQIEIVRNDKTVQAVFYNNTYYITAYERVKLPIRDGEISIPNPGIYMLTNINEKWQIKGYNPDNLTKNQVEVKSIHGTYKII